MPSPATSFVSLSPMPASSASTTAGNDHHPMQGTQDRPIANLPSQRRPVHAPLPPACCRRSGFRKVRYFGLWHPRQRHNAARVPRMLQLQAPPKLDQPLDFAVLPIATADAEAAPSIEPLVCHRTMQGQLIFIRTLLPPRRAVGTHDPQHTSASKRFALVTACAGTPQRPLVSGAIGRTSFGDGSVAARPETAAPSIDGSAQSPVHAPPGTPRCTFSIDTMRSE